MDIIDHYEPAFTRYKGTGRIAFAGGLVVDAQELEVVQREDGTGVVGCISGNFLPWEPATFVGGEVAAGQPFRGSHLAWNDSGQLDAPDERYFYVGLPRHFSVNRPSSPAVQEIKFSLVNLRRDQGGVEFRPFTINLGGYTFDFAGVADYSSVIKRIRATTETRVTSFCMVTKADGFFVPLAIRWMDYICSLLSLARGNKVTWIRYDATDSKTGKAYSMHRTPKTKPFGMQMSIVGFEPDLDICAAHWSDSKLSRGNRDYLVRRIDYFLDALNPGQFLQGNALAAAALVDALANHHASVTETEFKVNDESAWKALRKELEKCVKEKSKPYAVNLTESLEELRRFTFRAKLTKLLDDLGLASDIINELKPIRDELVHKGDFPPNTNRRGRGRAYAVLVWTAFTVLMRLSGYKDDIQALPPFDPEAP